MFTLLLESQGFTGDITGFFSDFEVSGDTSVLAVIYGFVTFFFGVTMSEQDIAGWVITGLDESSGVFGELATSDGFEGFLSCFVESRVTISKVPR